MTSLFSSVKGGTMQTPQDQQARKAQFMQQIQQTLAMENARMLMDKMGEKCFTKCITKPSASISSSDEACLSRCMDRWLETFNVVSRSYVARAAKEREAAGALAGPSDAITAALGDTPEYI